MAGQTAVVTASLKVGGLTIGGATEIVTSDAAKVLTVEIPALTTDKEVDFVITKSEVKAFAVECDKAVTLDANKANTPDFTLSVAAGGVPSIWTINSSFANPITANVTKFFVTNASTFPAILKLGVLTDITP